MKQVLHVINGEFYSGAERVQDHLAAQLPNFGYDVQFACLKPMLFPQAAKAAPESIHSFPMKARLDLGPAFRMARFIRKCGIALIHTHTPRAALIGSLAALLSGRPMIHHLHSPTMADTETGLRNRINTIIEKLSTLGAKQFIAVSNNTASWYLERGVQDSRMTVVHNGVPCTGPLPKRNAPGNTWIIGTVALFRPRKGLEVLINALSILNKSGHKVRLLAVGNFETDTYRDIILAQAKALGVNNMIEWTGFTKDVPAALKRMDCFVLPSLYGEGLPMVVLEAMAVGTPVVATLVEGVPEAVRNGMDGLLARPGDAKSLADATEKLLADPELWINTRKSAQQRQQEGFSDVSMAKGVAQIYDKVLGA